MPWRWRGRGCGGWVNDAGFRLMWYSPVRRHGGRFEQSYPLERAPRPLVNDRLTAIAMALDKPKAWIVEQAVKDFVAVHEWQLAAIHEGIRQADAGSLIPHEKIVAWVESWGKPNELPMPKCD
jgi:predicted transcriptional regulator